MAFDRSLLFVDHLETGVHRLIVRDALRIVTFHDPDQLIGQGYRLFLDYLVVPYDIQYHVRGDQSDPVDLIFLKELIGDLDHSLTAHLVAVQVVSDRDRKQTLPTNIGHGIDDATRTTCFNT